jgi:peptide/nickel transport system permease protein
VSGTLADDSLASAGQLRLTWLRFKRHRLAFISLFVVALFYLVAIFADFLAINDPHAVDARRGYLPPQVVHIFGDSGFNPHVDGMTGKRDMKTFKQVYVPDPNKKLPVTWFAHGYRYEMLGLFETDRHLLGLVSPEPLNGSTFWAPTPWAATCFLASWSRHGFRCRLASPASPSA